jgi:hypothetical protein
VDEETLKHLLRGLGPTNPEGHVAPTAFVGMKKRIKIWKRIIGNTEFFILSPRKVRSSRG